MLDKYRLETLFAVFNLTGFTSEMLEVEPKSMVKLAFDPRRSNNPFALILTGSDLFSPKSCSVMISGRVFSVWDPLMLVLDANLFRFELKLGVNVDFCTVSSSSHESFCLNCLFGVFGMEKTSLDTSKLVDCFGGSESRLTALNFFDRVGVFGDCITNTGWFVTRDSELGNSKFGKFLSFLSSMLCSV